MALSACSENLNNAAASVVSAVRQLCCIIWLTALISGPECMSVTTDHLHAERVHAPLQYDAILKITSTCICGSDLHMYTGAFPGVRKGDQLGHEVTCS